MKNVLGSALTLTLFGESHGQAIGAVLDGVSPGIKIDEARIAHQLELRRPAGKLSTARAEQDEFRILSGVYRGFTTGTPLCIEIPNSAQDSSAYENYGEARPGHADYTNFCKYHGFEDARGGGHASGRLTAALVAAAGVILPALEQRCIFIGTHLQRCAGIEDRSFDDFPADIAALSQSRFPVLSVHAAEAMQLAIENAAASGDSVGGVLQTAVIGLPTGLGEPWFGGMESALAQALFAIPAVKGVSFGKGFELADMRGSQANGELRYENGRVLDIQNNNGGILGGITSGMPVIINIAVKPTPSVFCKQNSVDFVKEQNISLELQGRHDPCIAHRARVVADSVCALVAADMLLQRFGSDYLSMKQAK